MPGFLPVETNSNHRLGKRFILLNSNRGFTLLELMVIIAIIAIALAIGSPYLKDMQRRQQLNSEAQKILQNLNQARSEAGKRNSQVAMTFRQPVSGTTYSYVVYIDGNRNFEYDAGEATLAEIQLEKGISFDTSKGGGDGIAILDNDDGLPSLAWNSRGQPRINGNAFGAGDIYLTDSDGLTRTLSISSAGRVRIQ